jgi:hypothetical protein
LPAAILAAAAIEADVKPLVGPSVSGRLAGLTSAEVRLQAADGEKVYAVGELSHITVRGGAKAAESSPAVWVDLADGSRLLATGYAAASGQAAVDLLGHGTVKLLTSSIRSVRWTPQDETLAKQWLAIVDGDSQGDVIVVRRPPAALDQWEGVLHDIEAEVVQFELDGDRLSIPRDRLEGVVYYQALGGKPAKPICQVVDVHGSQWQVQSLTLENENVRLTTVGGVDFQIPVRQIERFDFSTGNVVYLSDLTPASVRWTPFFPSSAASSRLFKLFQPRRDRSFDGGRLLLGRKAYEKGLAIHSRTELAYRLTEDFRRLRATAGIDDRVREAGNVKLVISGDGRPLFEKTITGKEPPLELDLDITGVRRLNVLVDFGEELDIGDHLNLGDARLTK